MSVITDVILLPGPNNNHSIAHTLGLRLTDMSDSGGNKVFCSDLYAGSFNHLDIDRMITEVREFPWTWPDEWRLLYHHEYYFGWTVVTSQTTIESEYYQ